LRSADLTMLTDKPGPSSQL